MLHVVNNHGKIAHILLNVCSYHLVKVFCHHFSL